MSTSISQKISDIKSRLIEAGSTLQRIQRNYEATREIHPGIIKREDQIISREGQRSFLKEDPVYDFLGRLHEISTAYEYQNQGALLRLLSLEERALIDQHTISERSLRPIFAAGEKAVGLQEQIRNRTMSEVVYKGILEQKLHYFLK